MPKKQFFGSSKLENPQKTAGETKVFAAMSLKLGDEFPDFSAVTNQGELRSFHDWIGSSWAILFSHPADFTPVCTTELARAVQLNDEFEKRDVKLIALSCDSAKAHNAWIPDILSYGVQVLQSGGNEGSFPFPIIADDGRELANTLGMLDPDEIGTNGLPLTARAVFVVGPDRRLKLSLLYPATTGRNFDEILRVVDSLQLTAQKKVATPVDWKVGDKCMIVPSVSDGDVEALFGEKNVQAISVPSSKNYLRLVDLTSAPSAESCDEAEKNDDGKTSQTPTVVEMKIDEVFETEVTDAIIEDADEPEAAAFDAEVTDAVLEEIDAIEATDTEETTGVVVPSIVVESPKPEKIDGGAGDAKMEESVDENSEKFL